MRITYMSESIAYIKDDFALRYVLIYPGVTCRVELATLAAGLRTERRLAALARGKRFELLQFYLSRMFLAC